MASPSTKNITLSPETVYATKTNVAFPGTQAQATAAEARAQQRIADTQPAGTTVAVAAGSIKVAS